jgi:nucleotide sugar dehydrogenase
MRAASQNKATRLDQPNKDEKEDMGKFKVTVLGLGVGYSLAVILAECGLEVTGIDIDPKVVEHPRMDPSIRDLIAKERTKIERHLKLTTDYEAMKGSKIVIVCVSTGDEKELVLGSVKEAVREALKVLRKEAMKSLILVYSTLPFGSSQLIKNTFRQEGVKIDKEISYCYMPLMIAGGEHATGFVNPPFLVFGSYSRKSAQIARNFYLNAIKRSSFWDGKNIPTYIVQPEEAELVKLVANAFLSTKMSFANMVAFLCEKLHLDGNKILDIVGSHPAIGSRHFRAGFAFSGNCFPRDLQHLIRVFRENGIEPSILEAAQNINMNRLLSPIYQLGVSKIAAKRIAILGKSYKGGVADVRGSYNVLLGRFLEQKGYTVNFYDPNIEPGMSLNDLDKADTIVVLNKEEKFAELGRFLRKDSRHVILDYAGVVNTRLLPDRCKYFRAGIGWVKGAQNLCK